jgi:Zn-dependent protease with chaperone function
MGNTMSKPAVPDHYDETIARIRALWARWEPMLKLPGVEVTHRFLETTRDDEEATAADTEVKWAYRRATIRWYLPVVYACQDDELESIAVHEFSHILLGTVADRLKSGSDEQCEHATESVARALLAAYRG